MADPIWARDLVLTGLRRRDRGGEGPASKEELQELGIGATDLEVTLGVLVDEGSVVEHPDGSFELNAVEGEEQGPSGSSPDADALLEGDAAAAAQEGDPAVPAWQPPDDGTTPAPRPPAMVPHAAAPIMDGGDVRMTRGMVEKLSDETLGNVIRAGLTDHASGRFVLVIE